MNKELNAVKSFNQTAGVKTIQDFEPEATKLSVRLMTEELDEIVEAIEEKNRVEVLDGICDLLYVTLGFAYRHGFANNLEEAFRRVHESNMSKFPVDALTAQETLKKYQEEGVEAYFEQEGEFYIIRRKSDGKVLKSKDYNPVNLTDLA